MEENDEIKEGYDRMILWYTELAESCDVISILSKESLKILRDPFRMMFEFTKLDDNINLINLKFASLCQLGQTLTDDDEGKEG